MFHRTPKLLLRFVLLVMLATFLSPSFGWGMVASHDQLEHAFAGPEHVSTGHGHPGHDATDTQSDSQDHQDAHTSIGHLLTHMSAGLFEMPRLDIPPRAQAELPAPSTLVLHIVPKPLFRPPRALLPH